MEIDIEIQSDEYTIREIDPDDDWDRGRTGLTYLGVKARRTSRVKTGDFRFEWPDGEPGKIGDTIVVLIEHYEDGNTFGSSEYLEAKGVFASEELAREHAESIPTDHGYFGNHIGFIYANCTIEE